MLCGNELSAARVSFILITQLQWHNLCQCRGLYYVCVFYKYQYVRKLNCKNSINITSSLFIHFFSISLFHILLCFTIPACLDIYHSSAVDKSIFYRIGKCVFHYHFCCLCFLVEMYRILFLSLVILEFCLWFFAVIPVISICSYWKTKAVCKHKTGYSVINI